MKQLFLYLIITTLCSVSVAQNTELLIGYKTLKTVYLTANYSVSDFQKVGLSLSYTFPISAERYWSGSLMQGGVQYPLTRGFNQQGPGIGFNYMFKANKNVNKWHKFTIEYRYLFSGLYIDDMGKFSGKSSSDYNEFKDIYNNFSFLYGYHGLFSKSQRLGFFFEGGFVYKAIIRTYSVTGTFAGQIPSNEIEHLNVFTATLRFGIEFKII